MAVQRIPFGEVTLDPTELFRRDVREGLSLPTKTISSKYFYDDEGSRLFQQIMKLPEYYLTRCEHEVLRDHGARLATQLPRGEFQLIELGAGDGEKTATIIEAWRHAGRRFVYRPIDISEEAIRNVRERMRQRFPELPVEGVTAEYLDGLRRTARTQLPKVILFLGSNIGNFTPQLAHAFLRDVRRTLAEGDLFLAGFDLVKDPAVLHAAYSDSQGVTAAFNRNLLVRINRELGGDFDPDKFRHCAAYNFRIGAMESYLVSLEAQRVRLAGVPETFDLAPWEPVFTECSFKYSPNSIDEMARAAGFRVRESVTDAKGWFCDSLWEAM